MAEENKEKYSIDFQTNADDASKDVQGLRASIDQTTEATKKSTTATDNQEEQYKSLKVQLREAIIEQQKLSAQYGSTSAEAIKATKAVAGIKDEIGFQKDLVASYNPDEKFRKLTQTAGIAALSLGGVKDGFTALGIESQVLDKVIGSAQAILGVTSSVAGLSDAYAVLTASKKAKSAADVVEVATTEAVAVAEVQATTAAWSWNAALLANPIVAITAGIVAAIAVVYAFVKITGDAAKEEEKAKVASMQLTQAIEHQATAFEKNSKFNQLNNNHKIDLLRASGASEAQIYKETKALADQDLQLAKNFEKEAIRAEQRAYEANRDNPTEFNAQTLKKAQENISKAEAAVSAGYGVLISLQNSHEVAVVQAQTDANQKAADKQREAEAKRLQDKKDANAKLLEEQKKFDADVLAQIGVMNVAKVNQDIQDQIDERARKEQSIFDAFDVAQKVEDENNEKRDKDLAKKKKEADDLDAIQLESKDRMLANGEALAKGVQALAGKNKAVQKAGIIAEGGINLGKSIANTAAAVTSDLKLGFPANIAPIALDIATGAVSAASIVSGTNKALQAVGGGGSITAPAPQQVPNGVSATPQTGFQASSENQIATSISASQQTLPIIKTYVVGSEVKTQTDLDAKLIQQNSFG